MRIARSALTVISLVNQGSITLGIIEADNTGVVQENDDDWINDLDSQLDAADAADDAAAATNEPDQSTETSSQADEDRSFDEIVGERETSNDSELDRDDPALKTDDSTDSDDKGAAAEELQATETEAQAEPVQTGVPWSRFREVNRSQKETNRELQEARKLLAERDELIEHHQRQAKVAGIELSDLNSLEFNEEAYLEMVDAGNATTANLLLKQQKEIDRLKQSAPAPVVDDPDDDGPSDEEVGQAITANTQLSEWRSNAAKGDRKAWEAAIKIDESIPDDEFESLADRYAEVERRVLKQAKEAAAKKTEAAATPDSGPARSLNDMGGNSGTEDAFTRLMAMSIDKQMDYMEQLERSNPRLHAELDTRIDEAL